MEQVLGPRVDNAAALIDGLAAHQRVLNAAQARLAALMLDFADRRRHLDRRRIADLSFHGGPQRYAEGEFAAVEVALATVTAKSTVARLMAVAARLQLDAPAVWAAWSAGEIDQDRAFVIEKALCRLIREDSRRLLNQAVVPVAACRTVELLRRWLNQFVARTEPDGTNERLKRAFEDRYVSIRPGVDGMTFLSAGLAAVDATAIDQVLDALAGAAESGDARTVTQRRADALVDVLLGRVSNGCDVDRIEGDEPKRDETIGVDVEPGEGSNDAGRRSRAVVRTGKSGHRSRAPSVSIGVVVSIQSLLGYTSTPGQLADRSALLPADLVREFARQPGTLFHRLLTDERGNLLDVTELGRFPSRRLGLAVGYRTPTCVNPTCDIPAHDSDLDHVVPAPDGPTSAENLDPKCRSDHRAKTHAGHRAERSGNRSSWTTPTGHTYTNEDEPLPVENWPDQKHERAG